MGGLRPDPVYPRRLADIARAGGGRGAGGYLPATAPQQPSTVHTPGRIMRPDISGTEPAPGGAGPTTAVFSASGPLTVTDYPTRLHNIYGRTLDITKVAGSLGTTPSGSDTTAQLKLNGSVVVNLTFPPGSTYVEVDGFVELWEPGTYLTVNVLAVGSGAPGEDLVVQALAS